MSYTEKELSEIFALENVDNVRYEYATTRTRHSKKGKNTVQTGGAYFVLKYRSGLKITLPTLVKLANELNERPDVANAQDLEPFCRSLISRSVVNITKRALLKALGLSVSDELNKACKDEETKNEERTKKRVNKILDILENGREKYVKNEGKRARENAGKRFDVWEAEYSAAAGASDDQ